MRVPKGPRNMGRTTQFVRRPPDRGLPPGKKLLKLMKRNTVKRRFP